MVRNSFRHPDQAGTNCQAGARAVEFATVQDVMPRVVLLLLVPMFTQRLESFTLTIWSTELWIHR